jgi:hypothetical protein
MRASNSAIARHLILLLDELNAVDGGRDAVVGTPADGACVLTMSPRTIIHRPSPLRHGREHPRITPCSPGLAIFQSPAGANQWLTALRYLARR